MPHTRALRKGLPTAGGRCQFPKRTHFLVFVVSCLTANGSFEWDSEGNAEVRLESLPFTRYDKARHSEERCKKIPQQSPALLRKRDGSSS